MSKLEQASQEGRQAPSDRPVNGREPLRVDLLKIRLLQESADSLDECLGAEYGFCIHGQKPQP